MTVTTAPFNPYVGPRTFQEDEADRFFGREREARELLALVVSERLTLFYAQSGAGKSSLINTRLAPDLRQEGFTVLPVGRVSGVLPEEVAPQTVDNIFVYHLILGLSQKLAENDLRPLADTEQALPDLVDTSLARFLSGETGPEPDMEADAELTAAAGLVPHVLIIDQFEELLTTYPDRWQERAGFFERLSEAMARHPNLWVVLTLREDYIAGLEPYAHLMPNRLRARFYMQRMGIEAAREAVERPAAQAKRPFAKGVPSMLVDNLRMVRTAGQIEYHAGEYVEPVQLQVVCFQLWEDLRDKQAATIELADLERLAGGGNLAEYVDRALSDFYEKAIARVLEASDTGVTELALRSWFSNKLITEAGTRSIVFRNETTGDTVGLPNRAVDLLTAQFLLRTELRAGGAWVELVHDRFIEPIQRSNQQWSLQQSLPEIVRFEVHPKVISPGVEITVAWEVKNADIVQVEPIGLALDSLKGTVKVSLEHSTPLQLSAKRQGQPPVFSRAQNVVVVESARASQNPSIESELGTRTCDGAPWPRDRSAPVVRRRRQHFRSLDSRRTDGRSRGAQELGTCGS